MLNRKRLRDRLRLRAFGKKGSGTVVRSTLWAVPATVPDPFFPNALSATLSILGFHSLSRPFVGISSAPCARQHRHRDAEAFRIEQHQLATSRDLVGIENDLFATAEHRPIVSQKVRNSTRRAFRSRRSWRRRRYSACASPALRPRPISSAASNTNATSSWGESCRRACSRERKYARCASARSRVSVRSASARWMARLRSDSLAFTFLSAFVSASLRVVSRFSIAFVTS